MQRSETDLLADQALLLATFPHTPVLSHTKIWTEGSDKWFRKIERLSGIKYFPQFVDDMMSNMQPM